VATRAFIRLAPLLAAAACASARPSPAAQRTIPSPAQAVRIEDLADRRLDWHVFEDAALQAGAADGALEGERAALNKALEPLVASIPLVEAAGAARDLLQVLHEGTRSAPPMLRRYDASATTLGDVLHRGRFNCVSATLLYLIAACRLGLDARAVLLPSHARAVVVVRGRRHVVETTAARGFDAPPEVGREVMRRFRAPGGFLDLYPDAAGQEFDDLALLGAVYTNLSVAARERDDLAAAEELDARADRLVDPSARPLLRRVRASTLQELALRRFEDGRTQEALELVERAVALVPDGDEAREAQGNLLAVAQRRMDELGGDEMTLLAFPSRFSAFPSTRAALEARAWNLAASQRAGRGDTAGAAAAAREAERAGRSTENREVYAHNLAAAELNRLQEVARTDPDEAWRRWQALKVPAALADTHRRVGANLAAMRVQKALDALRCDELDARAQEWTVLAPEAPAVGLRAACRNNAGVARSMADDHKGAADLFREALRLKPSARTFRENLVAALKNEVSELVRDRRCDEAARVLAEGARLAPDDAVFEQARRACAGP